MGRKRSRNKVQREWTTKERWRVRRARMKQAKLLRVMTREFGARTKTQSVEMLDADLKQRLEREE
jgi:hypothetical protein